MLKFKNAKEAFEKLYEKINKKGIDFDNTKALFEVGFIIENPLDNLINTYYRNWSYKYAQAEWMWYLLGDNNIKTLGEIYGKIPDIWKRMADDKGFVNSNYGYQWKRNNQLKKVINDLIENPRTRQACISIYDNKENELYSKDTPCTYAVQFTVIDNKLNMSVYMRSNDLWFGFCNDQYCFSLLQQMVSQETGYEIGTYYHHAHNMHIYNDFLNRD